MTDEQLKAQLELDKKEMREKYPDMSEKKIQKIAEVVLMKRSESEIQKLADEIILSEDIKKKKEIEAKNEMKKDKSGEKRIVSSQEVFQMKEEKEPYLIDKLIPEEAITMMSADTGKGKSIIALKFAKAIATGEKLWDTFKVKQKKVLIIDMEMNRHNIIKRNRQVLQEATDIDYYYEQDFQINEEKDFNWLVDMIEQNGYGFVIFDTLSSIHGKEENSTTEMALVNKALLRLTRKHKVTILYLHHNAKAKNGERSGYRGSTDLPAKVASHLAVIGMKGVREDGKKKNVIIMTQEKSRDADEINKIRFEYYVDNTTDTTGWKYLGEVDIAKMAIDSVKEDVLELMKDGNEMTIKEIIANLKAAGKKHGDETVRKALQKLFDIGTLIKYPGGQGRADKRSNEISFTCRTEDKEAAEDEKKWDLIQ